MSMNYFLKSEIKLTTEEKILCLIPVIGAYIDIFTTFFIAGDPSTILAFEMNALLKASIISNFAIFYYMIITPFFILFTFLICIVKLSKRTHELQYIISFSYFGLRISGGSTWLLAMGIITILLNLSMGDHVEQSNN